MLNPRNPRSKHAAAIAGRQSRARRKIRLEKRVRATAERGLNNRRALRAESIRENATYCLFSPSRCC